jgi:hypothetical protein
MRIVALLTAAALLPGVSAADCGIDSAAVARQFWEDHSRLFQGDDPTLHAATTSRFYASLERLWACTAKNPACLGYEPWPSPGDKRIAVRPTFNQSDNRPDHVLVLMTYALAGPGGKAGPDEVVILTLTQDANGRCWLVDDVLTHRDRSLRVRLHHPDS